MKKPFGDSWFVYIVRCADGSLYTGITKDVKRRCQQHNDGTASRYTRIGGSSGELVEKEINGRNPAVLDDDEIGPGVSACVTEAAR